jgi:hypothetical protein
MHDATLDIAIKIYFDHTGSHLIAPNDGRRRVLLLGGIAKLAPHGILIKPDQDRGRSSHRRGQRWSHADRSVRRQASDLRGGGGNRRFRRRRLVLWDRWHLRYRRGFQILWWWQGRRRWRFVVSAARENANCQKCGAGEDSVVDVPQCSQHRPLLFGAFCRSDRGDRNQSGTG